MTCLIRADEIFLSHVVRGDLETVQEMLTVGKAQVRFAGTDPGPTGTAVRVGGPLSGRGLGSSGCSSSESERKRA